MGFREQIHLLYTTQSRQSLQINMIYAFLKEIKMNP